METGGQAAGERGRSAKEAPAALGIATLDEARARAPSSSLTEREQTTVPELLVDNRGKVAVLLLAGEILVGGKQNRVLKEDLLLPPSKIGRAHV